MSNDVISTTPKVELLKKDLAEHHDNNVFANCRNMGEIVITNIQLLLAKDFKQSIVY